MKTWKNSTFLCILTLILMSFHFISCVPDYDLDNDYWTPPQQSLEAPWNVYLVGEKTTDTSGSVYGKGSSTDTFDGTNIIKVSTYQSWDGGSKFNSYNLYITRIALYQASYETYPSWCIFYKMGGLWHSQSDFDNRSELSMRVPKTLGEKSLSDFVEIPGP